jgi:hypothetical protein
MTRLRFTISLAIAVFGSLLLTFAPHSAWAQVSSEKSTRILFIGNSYTGQIRNTVKELIAASPSNGATEIEFITPGGKTLEFHLSNEKTTKRIAEGNWDYVVLQDQSQTPAVFPQRFEDAAVELDKLIDAAGAKTVFYQTWGRRDGDKQNAQRFPEYSSMQKALSKSYASVARKCDAILAPVGDTWAKVREVDAELGVALYKGDGSHPSAAGAYLAACVLFSAIFEESPQEIEYKGGLSEDQAKVILQALK